MLVQVFAGVTQVDQLAGDRQVGEGQSLADEEGPAVEMVFQVIEVRWQLFLQRATHVVLLAGLAHRQTIDWPAPSGKTLKLTLLEIEYQPEAAGDYAR